MCQDLCQLPHALFSLLVGCLSGKAPDWAPRDTQGSAQVGLSQGLGVGRLGNGGRGDWKLSPGEVLWSEVGECGPLRPSSGEKGGT